MQKISINNQKYEVIKNYKDAINEEEITSKLTEYFEPFEYVVGDFAYNKLRLKGFYDCKNPNCKKYNNINNLEKYLENNCAYGCKYFVIKKCS